MVEPRAVQVVAVFDLLAEDNPISGVPEGAGGCQSITGARESDPPERSGAPGRTSRDISDLASLDVWRRRLGASAGGDPPRAGWFPRATRTFRPSASASPRARGLRLCGDAPAMPVGIFELAASVPVELVLDRPENRGASTDCSVEGGIDVLDVDVDGYRRAALPIWVHERPYRGTRQPA